MTDSREEQSLLPDSRGERSKDSREEKSLASKTASVNSLDEDMPVLRELMFGGAVKRVSAVTRFLLLHQAGLKMIRDVDAEPDVTAYTPLRSAAVLTNLKLTVVDLLITEEFSGNTEKARQVVSQLAHDLASHAEVSDRRISDNDSLQQALQDAGVSEEQTESIMTGYSTFCKGLNVKQECDNFERDPRAVQVIPLHNLGTYASLLDGALSGDEARWWHEPFFAMSALLRRHGLAEAAAALHFRMDCITHYSTDQEMAMSTFDLSSVPTYMSTLPGPVQQLLRLTSCRAPPGAAYLFDSLVAWPSCRGLVAELEPSLALADVELRPALLRRLQRMAEPAELRPPDVTLTHLVMLLCALHVAGDDTGEVLRQIRAAAGPETCRRARRSLRRWRVAPVVPSCSPCSCRLM